MSEQRAPDDDSERAPRSPQEFLFSPAVLAEQERLGSRAMFARRPAEAWKTEITEDLREFLAVIDTFFLATASGEGQPYVQHRGGPAGFLKPLGPRTLGFADFAGNRQYITLGHLAENPRAFLFIPHFATRQRLKFWGRARVVEDDGVLIARLAVPGYPGKVERAIVFEVDVWDVNCPSHITQRYTEDEIAPAIDKLVARIKELKELVARLRAKDSPDDNQLKDNG
jgi:predicted pyridoxine 5'-phosphate oxidase superfamily flavin-nucleotide-binding protein